MRPINQDTEQFSSEPPTLGAVENAADEAGILSDQDETMMSNLSADDPNIGSDGTDDDFGADAAEFARGEIDLKEQMDRTMAHADHIVHRPRDPSITPHSKEGQVRSEPTRNPAEAMDSSITPKSND